MKFTTISAVLCLVAPAVLADKQESRYINAMGKRGTIQHHEIGDVEMSQGHPVEVVRREYHLQKSHQQREHVLVAHRDGETMGKDDDSSFEEHGDDDKDKKGQKDMNGNGNGTKKKGGEGEDKKVVEDNKKVVEDNKKVVEDNKKGTDEKKDAAKAGPNDGKKDTVDDSKIPRDYASPLWIVQPYGASVWEQDRAYVISWGPNPNPDYAKAFKAQSPINIRLMQGPPDNLREVAVLQVDADAALNSFQWTVPATIPPADDYSIRLTHPGKLDAYSHYFEVVEAGDSRSSKSNVGEPLQMPQASNVLLPSDKGSKGPIIKPATPPNPFPADVKSKPVNPVSAPAGAKPAAQSAAMGETQQNANMLAFALTLFGAVYLL
ncbi:hypothetical protein BG011_009557 [Mortierella polycephala]|uniref:Yeast cell wall synthesis Kre9/Knh1-like N-terminal domain-containing protein n=1 Tax=Mortierella polycephala TaxID=41804 RepID=A0A9P6PL19_9FUNG|nr:hypothetical protein BG011_009557 [Mortierella polycephala]